MYMSYYIHSDVVSITLSQFIKKVREYLNKNFGQVKNCLLVDSPYGLGIREEFMFVGLPYIQIGGIFPENWVAIRKITNLTDSEENDLSEYCQNIILENLIVSKDKYINIQNQNQL